MRIRGRLARKAGTGTAGNSPSSAALAVALAAIEGVGLAAVWKLGEVPVCHSAPNGLPPATGKMLCALMGTLEKRVEDLGLGHLTQLWWQADRVQCVGFRAGEWQVLVLAEAASDVGSLRTQVAGVVSTFWENVQNSGEENAS